MLRKIPRLSTGISAVDDSLDRIRTSVNLLVDAVGGATPSSTDDSVATPSSGQWGRITADSDDGQITFSTTQSWSEIDVGTSLLEDSTLSMPSDGRMRYDGSSDTRLFVVARVSVFASSDLELRLALAIENNLQLDTISRIHVLGGATGSPIQHITCSGFLSVSSGDIVSAYAANWTGTEPVTVSGFSFDAFAV